MSENTLKKTKGREMILSVLREASFPMTCEEIYGKVSRLGLNLSTVYRSLNSFAKAGLVKKETGEEKKNVFSLVTSKDHHILVCVRCHKRVELPGCPYHEANSRISASTGFQILDHSTEIYGVCPECQKKAKK